MEADARRAAEQAARVSYGRLVAYLAARSRDIAAAEDALADAFRTALEVWPVRGVPDNPEAWLLTAARRNLGHAARHSGVRDSAMPELMRAADEAQDRQDEAGMHANPFPDERLKLLFLCAHPAIDPTIHTPLMLQTVLGLDAGRIASVFLAAPATMGQRLVRAKTKIRDAGIPFTVPGREDLPARLEAVLAAIYAAYTAGWDLPADAGGSEDLAGEAIWLARLAVALLPDAPEARGLLALLLHCEARREARRGTDGAYIPLTEQDPARWSRELIMEAERELARAARFAVAGRFQFEAAIQSAHVQRAVTGRTDWGTIAMLYDLLVQVSPSAGALVGRAAAHGEAHGPHAGLALLAELPEERVAGYQPYWATRAHLLATAGDIGPAREAYARAAGLSGDPGVRAFLLRRAARLLS